MSELFERMKTRRASGDTKFEGIPVPAWRGGAGEGWRCVSGSGGGELPGW